ncbi:RBBP8 N-terminal-like protein isoform X2 [Hyperolius riggenbachi]
MQAKLTELTMEKCRDAQRIEELFSKNHILREQHKVLNENIKVLENRLRAGLCDRCTVTQELAKKKQQEYESCHFHSLQQISSLTNEINILKEENKALLDELRKFKCLEMERSRSRSNTPENDSTPEVQHPALPCTNAKISPEKTSKDGESKEYISDYHMPEDTSSAAVLKLSPVVKSLQTAGHDTRQAEMTMSGVQKVLLSNHNQQRISNQLHGTIAVMRAGAKSGHLMYPSPLHKRSSCNDLHSNEGRTELYDAPSPLDSLKHVIPEEQLQLLRQHFAQKRLRSPGMPNDLPMRYLLAKNRESAMERKRSEDDWEEKAAMADLQGAVLYVRDQEYKNRINPTDQREKIHYLFNKQNQGLRSPTSPGDVPKCHMRESPEKELSLIQVLSARWKNNKGLTSHREEQDWPEKDMKAAEPEKRSHYEEDATPDKPLDLSDTRRGQNSKREHTCLYETHMARPASRNNSSPPTRDSESDHVHGATTADHISVAKNEHERHSTEDTREADMDHSGDPEMARESLAATRAVKGHKRHRDSEPDEEDARGNSPQRDMAEEPDTSDSEMERSQHSQAETSRDGYKSHGQGRWKKRLSLASKKSMRKKRKDPDQAAESDSSQDDDV